MVAVRPIDRSEAANQSAARTVSALCSDRALTLGMRRNSNNSSSERPRLAARWLARSLARGIWEKLGGRVGWYKGRRWAVGGGPDAKRRSSCQPVGSERVLWS